MKTLRTLGLLLGALSCAAGLFAQSPITWIPNPGQIDHRFDPNPVATYELLKAMPPIPSPEIANPVAFDGTVLWKVYTEKSPGHGKPKNRVATWMTGTINNPAGQPLDVDLHVIGAQIRGKIVWLRVVSADPSVEITLVEDNRKAVKVLQSTKAVGNPSHQFYKIDPSNPAKIGTNLVAFDKRYRLTSKLSTCMIEIFYDGHRPGSTPLQNEDGGPPAVPPVGEN